MLLKVRLSVDAVTLLEAVYTSAGVYQLLPAGIERMALGANFDLELALDGAGLKGLATCATDDAFTVRGMDILFHRATPYIILLGAARLTALLLHSETIQSRTDDIIPLKSPESKDFFDKFALT